MQPALHPTKKRSYKRHPFSERKRVVELYLQGLGSKRIAAQLGIDDSQVRSWLRKYKAYGVESLHPYRRSGEAPSSKGRSLHKHNEKQFQVAYRIYAGTLEPMASIARRHGLNYGSFRYYLLRYHPELAERRAALKREKKQK